MHILAVYTGNHGGQNSIQEHGGYEKSKSEAKQKDANVLAKQVLNFNSNRAHAAAKYYFHCEMAGYECWKNEHEFKFRFVQACLSFKMLRKDTPGFRLQSKREK